LLLLKTLRIRNVRKWILITSYSQVRLIYLLITTKRFKLFETARAFWFLRRLCVRTFTNTIIRHRNVWHNAELIGSHVSAAMNSYVGVTCLARWVSEEYGIAKSQTRYVAVLPSTTLLSQKHQTLSWFLDRNHFGVALFEKHVIP